MFCPKCGSTQSEDLKFCKSCGANLGVVRDALETGRAPGKFDWNRTWVAEMLQSGEDSVRKAKAIERLQGITPEVRRRNEIKAGVITSSVGIGLMVFLYIFMQGVILSGAPPPGAAEILVRVWIAGFIPLMVGLALIINGAFVNKLFAGSEKREEASEPGEVGEALPSEYLPPAETKRIVSGVPFSVTDETTRHLEEESVIHKTKTAEID